MHWFENEDFWRQLYPYIFPQSRFDAASCEVDQVLALCALASPRVVDLACGPGTHALEFARRGLRVTGVDRSRFLLDQALRRERETTGPVANPVDWVSSDLRDFLRPAAFDLAVSLFTSFGYFEDPGDDLRVLRNVHASLHPGGTLLIDLVGKEPLARQWRDSSTLDFPDGTVLVQYPHVLDDWSRLRTEWVLRTAGGERRYRFEYTLYSGRELKERLLQCGFHPVNLYGSLTGNPYDLAACQLIAVARKAG